MKTGYTGATSFNVDTSFDSHEENGTASGIIDTSNDDPSTKGDVAMWRGVIVQALMDAGSNSKKQEFRKAKAEAIAWLSGQCEDFKTVCQYANYHPDYVKNRAKEAIARGCKWREHNHNSFTKNRKKKQVKEIKNTLMQDYCEQTEYRHNIAILQSA